MAKRRSASSRRGGRTAKSAARTPAIDYSDLPPLSDEQLASMRRVGRPRLPVIEVREMISIRLDPQVLRQFKDAAKVKNVGYQTLINEVLAAHVPRPRAARKRRRARDVTPNVADHRRTHR
jgi:uncharacterized protein (DUF4415 family)